MGSPPHSHSSIWVSCYCICLSASHLYNKKGAQSPVATLHKALTYRRQRKGPETQSDLPVAVGSQAKSLGSIAGR